MKIINTRQGEIQSEAFSAWKSFNKKGTVALATGTGKTRVFFLAVQELPTTAKILFLAETTEREQDLREEQKNWECEDYDITFACYQSAYKWKNTVWDLVGADEIHESLTMEYSKFYVHNRYKQILGMTATAPGLKDYVDDVNKGLLKKDLLKTVAPICYKYKLETAVNEGVAAPYELLVIDLHLDDVIANISAGTKNNPFLTTEKKAYNFKNLKFEQCKRLPGHIREFAIRNASASRAKLLYELPSKITKTTQLISLLQNKRIVLFGNSLTALLEITPHVVSSRNSDTVNKQIRTDFNAGTINIIGSFKKLKQGANLHEADTAVIHSYYSKSKDYIQRAGRVLRQSDGKYSYIVVFRTLETQEMLWFDRMVEDIDPKRVKFFTDVESCANYVLTP